MQIHGFIWREDIIEKLERKHSVTPNEVEQIFTGEPRFLRKERGKVEGEDLYNALGQTVSGRFLSVFFIYKHSGYALIVTAREMSRRERRYYEKGRSA